MESRVLITGGCGYLGSRLAKKLHEKGYKVIVTDKVSPEFAKKVIGSEIEFREASLRVQSEVERALKDTDYILHFAAEIGPLDYMHERQADIIQVNSAIDSHIYPTAVKYGVKGILYPSSSMVFQHSPIYPYTENDLDKINPPTNIYGFSKLAGEYFCKAYQNQYGLPYTIIRYHNIYGPEENPKGPNAGHSHVIPALLDKVLNKKQYPIELLGNPEATRPFTYIEDAIEATFMIAEKMILGESSVINNDFNIGSGEAINMKKLAELIWELEGDGRPFKYKLVDTKSITSVRREVDISKIRKIIGWEPKVGLREGLQKTADWMKL